MNEIFVPATDASADTSGRGNSGFAVVEVRAGRRADEAKGLLEQEVGEFHRHDDLDLAEGSVSFVVSRVDEHLNCTLESCREVWTSYIKQKLVLENDKNGQVKLGEKSVTAFTKLFESCTNGESSTTLKKVFQDSQQQNELLKFLKVVFNVEGLECEVQLRLILTSQYDNVRQFAIFSF